MIQNSKLLLAVSLNLSMVWAVVAQSNSDSILANSDFSRWQDEKPAGWTIGVGATNGSGAKSRVSKGEDSSLELGGNAKTKVWQYVSQEFQPQKDVPYLLKIVAKTTDVKREGSQFDNCHLNYSFKNKSNQKIQQKFFLLDSNEYEEVLIPFKPLPETTTVEIGVFLSKSGQLNIKSIELQTVNLQNSFDALIADMDRNYSYFEHKNIDWKTLTEKYRPEAEKATSSNELKKTILAMLGEIDDGHIWINQGKQKFQKGGNAVAKTFVPNFDFAVIDEKLVDASNVGSFARIGKTADGFGYVRVTSLVNIDRTQLQTLVRKIESLFDCPGMIVDLRRNRGGAEPVASEIASLFADKARVYGRSKFRSGPKHNQLVESRKRTIGARKKGKTYTNPIVCMIGPGAVSSAEAFAMMMSAIEHCKTIGQPTRGSTGNPAPVHLVDGIDVYYSRWISMMPDGTPIEDNGVPVDELVEHVTGSDKTFERAVSILKDAVK